MQKKALWMFWLACLWVTGVFTALAPAQPPAEAEFKRAAVAPFLVGRREPHMDESMDQTLSCPINQICLEDPTIAPQAGITLTRLTHEYLRNHFGSRVVHQDEMRAAYGELILDESADTPRTLAMKLGPLLGADAVFVGTVWRYRDRGAISGVPDSPASVAFAVYLIDVVSGRQKWRGIYSVTQQPITENLFQVGEQLKLGLKWRTADELARIGVKEVFQDLLPGSQSP